MATFGNLNIVNADTDSVMVTRPDGSVWSKIDQQAFLDALNVIFPEKINFAHDGYYDSVVVTASKNYALLLNKDFAKKKDLDKDGNVKIKTKGSSIRDQKKEPAMREMMDKIIDALIYGKQDTIQDIYHSYVKEAISPINDIRRWCQKKSVSEAVLACKGYTEADIASKKLRRNETNIWDAICNEEGLQMGDKIYLYPIQLAPKITTGRIGKTGKALKDKVEEVTGLKMDKYWKNDHDNIKLVQRCYNTLEIFENVLDMSLFIDYTKKSNIKLLEQFK